MFPVSVWRSQAKNAAERKFVEVQILCPAPILVGGFRNENSCRTSITTTIYW